jgi:hydroxymethylpyrimidine pyrophosphatase-like HAD family hydrolase
VDIEEILYFGDSLNDLPVFELVPHTIAMANALPEVKARAWGLTASNNDDGVARSLSDLLGIALG